VSISRKIAFAVGAAWLARALAIGSNLLLLPVLFRCMDREELGLWMLLGGSYASLGLLGFGFAPILTRHIALAKGRSGADPDAALTDETRQHIADLVVTGRAVLRVLAVVSFFVALGLGALFVENLDLQRVRPGTVVVAWVVMCLGYATVVWVSYLDCWLTGLGYAGLSTLIACALSILTLLANIGAVLLGGGLLALAIILIASGLVQRYLLLCLLRRRRPEVLELHGRWDGRLARALLKPALLFWLSTQGAFLILQTDAYFIALMRSPSEVPNYRASYQVVYSFHQVAAVVATMSAVFLSQVWRAGDLALFHRLVLGNARVGMVIMAAGAAFVLTVGREAIELWLGPGSFLSYTLLAVFCVTLTLETQQAILMACARATEDERYTVCTLAAAGLNLGLTWLLIQWLGLLGVALGTLLAQLLTTNWYAVVRPLARMQVPVLTYARQVLGPWLLTLLAGLVLGHLVRHQALQLGLSQKWYAVALGAACQGVVVLLVCWFGVLDGSQRKALLTWLRGPASAGASAAVRPVPVADPASAQPTS
jgi:O-antigen/teichoic acid export membrane protein